MSLTSGPTALSSAPTTLASGRTDRPWGWFETLGQGDGYQVKRLRIRAGRRLSLQRHRCRSEHWVVVAGGGLLRCGADEIPARPGTTLFVPVGALHRATADPQADLEIIEVQRGDDLREDDIERFADDYGRVVGSGDTL